MSRRLLALAVLLALIATGASPSYCAEMLRASAGAKASSHQHHHHTDAGPARAREAADFTVSAAPCGTCGVVAAKAVTPDGRAKLVFIAEAAAVAPDARIPARLPSAASNHSAHSPAPPLLISLRI